MRPALLNFTRRLTLLRDSLFNPWRHFPIIIISDYEDWIIKNIAANLTSHLNHPAHRLDYSTAPYFLKNKLVHFGNIHLFISYYASLHPSNKIAVSWYHLNQRPVEINTARLLASRRLTVHTACSTTKRELIALGLKEDQIKIIPLGVDLNLFRPLKNPNRKSAVKKKLGLPDGKIIIGSFQKDGNGWGQGLEPKLVKGPDVFCDAVEQLARRHPLHVLLTGPARGYVKNRLTAAGIPFTHRHLKRYSDIVPYYHALDFYLITARAEGGPMALLESWATGTPLISTRVGMVNDLALDNTNALLTKPEDIHALVRQAEKIITQPSLSSRLAQNGLRKINAYSWHRLAPRYYQELYEPLLP